MIDRAVDVWHRVVTWDALEVTLDGDELAAVLGETALLLRRAV